MTVPEADEPVLALRHASRPRGVKDDACTGLNLRDHPGAYPRKELPKRGITPVPTPCGRHGQRIETTGSSSSAGVPAG